MTIIEFIVPMGIATLALVALTVLTALLRRVHWPKPLLWLRLHKVLGVCALIAGAAHATLVLFAD